MPKLCDFGMIRIRHEQQRTNTLSTEGGSMRYQAPELIQHDDFRITSETDCYAFGMTIYHLGTSNRPFSDVPNSNAVMDRVRKGHRPVIPPKPVGNLSEEATLVFWSLVARMWAQEPQDRPQMDYVEKEMSRISDSGKLIWPSRKVEKTLMLRDSVDMIPSSSPMMKFVSKDVS